MTLTPILDRQYAAPAQPPFRRSPALVIGAAFGLALVFIKENFHNGPGFNPLAALAVLIAGLSCGTVLHELGHVAAGIAVGFEFRRILAGPWMLTKEVRGYSLRFVPNHIFGG